MSLAEQAALPDLAAIRADFPILGGADGSEPPVYLDNAATTHKPRSVLERVVAFYSESNSNVHRGGHALSERATELYEAARETVRGFIGARDVREVVFTQGTTDAINLVAHGFGQRGLGPGDEIIVTELEHHSNLVPWQRLCERSGARLRIVPFEDDGSLRPDALAPFLSHKTKLVALAYVSNVLGLVNPVRELIAAAHERDVPVLLDAAQAAPHLPIDVQRLDCDFLAFSGHKLYAETGIGVLYGKAEWLEQMEPQRYGGGMVASVGPHEASLAELPFRLEAGTPNVAAAVSLAAAIEYVAAIGFPAIRAHEQGLMQYAMDALATIDGLRRYGTHGEKCGALAFNIEGANAHDVAVILDRLDIAVRAGTHCAEPLMRRYGVSGTVRASFGVYNTTEEIDRLVHALNRAQAMLA